MLLKRSSPTNTLLKPGLRTLTLGQQQLEYRLRRSKRRTIGFIIDEDGLRITAPKWVGIAQIDAAIFEKQQWILTKLHEQQQRAARDHIQQIAWSDGARFPYLGAPLTLKLIEAIRSRSQFDENEHCLTLFVPAHTPEAHIEQQVQTWLQHQARTLFADRLNIYADKLEVRCHGLALSSATTRWGSCSADGKIRLNWRLIHFNLSLIDYVIAHEVAHLLEMNHGPHFWAAVHSIFPDHAVARKTLRAHSPGSLPVF